MKNKEELLYGSERLYVFLECPSCATKPGSPDLCPSCLHNRNVIEKLTNELIKRRDVALLSDEEIPEEIFTKIIPRKPEVKNVSGWGWMFGRK